MSTGTAKQEAGAATPRWGMVIDVNRCVGCQTCTIACKHANDTLPGVQWRRVVDVELGAYPNVERLFLVTGCQHCAEPPCVPVCPTGATTQRADGLVIQDHDTCIGCGYCAVACPYQARTIAHDHRWYYGRETRQEQAVKHDERLGTAQKCTFCKDRVDDGLARGLKPGVDPAATPACASACISSAIQFGDFNDAGSNVSALLAGPHFQLNAELGTDPQIKYLYTTPAVPGREAGAAEADEERLADPANPLVGPLQELWDWRAAMNWICGGIASGFAVMAWLASLAAAVDPAQVPAAQGLAAAIMALGLFFVFLKIGRKLRFWRAVARPQTSWMTRELYVVAAFYPAVLANLLGAHAALSLVAGLLALGFLYCQARILHNARGIPAWRAPLVPAMVVASGLLEGLALLALLSPWLAADNRAYVPVMGIALAAANAALWAAYRRTAAAQGIPPLARRVIGAVTPLLHGLGHAAPAVFFALALVFPGAAPALLALAGAAALAGGAYWKFTLIVRAGYQQGFSMPMLPQRGSGSRAAPHRTGGFGAAVKH